MSNHTPGPWHHEQPWASFSALRGPRHELIFGLAAGTDDEKQPDDVCEANARLIASAPVLFQVAKRACGNCTCHSTMRPDIPCLSCAARAAIVQAEAGS